MSNKYLYLIPLSLMEVILQLAFFWLAPDVPCYWVVYAFGTIFTLTHIGVAFWTGTSFGTRRSAATIVGGSVCQVVLISTGGILLAIGSSVRDAVFSLLIASMLYIVIETFLILSIENVEIADSHMVNPFDNQDEDYYDEVDERNVDYNTHKLHGCNNQANERLYRRVNMNVDNGTTPPPLPVRR